MRIIILILPLFFILFNCANEENKETSDQKNLKQDQLIESVVHNSSVSNDFLKNTLGRSINPEAQEAKDTTHYSYYSIKARESLLNQKPMTALSYLNRGSIYSKNKSQFYFDKACTWAFVGLENAKDSMFKYLELAINSSPKDPFYFYARSRFYSEENKNEEALKDINKAIYLTPNDTDLVNQRGMYHFLLGSFEYALKDLSTPGYNSMDNPQFYEAQGFSYLETKKYKEAFISGNRLIKIDSAYAKGYVIKGTALYYLGKEKEGIKNIYLAAQLGDQDAINYIKEYEAHKIKK